MLSCLIWHVFQTMDACAEAARLEDDAAGDGDDDEELDGWKSGDDEDWDKDDVGDDEDNNEETDNQKLQKLAARVQVFISCAFLLSSVSRR